MSIGRGTIAITLAVSALLLGACGGDAGNEAAGLDRDLTGNGADPAVMAALQDQIMVDPQLAQQANKDVIRPPAQPASGGVPSETVAAGRAITYRDGELLKAPAPSSDDCDACGAQDNSVTLAGLAGQAGGLAGGSTHRGAAQCAARLSYSAAWAAKMPADMPLHPQARVVEAAGVEGDGCSLRVISFSTPQPLSVMIDYYYTRAIRGNYAAEHQARAGQHVLGGTRRGDGAAYLAFLSARADGGTEIDLIANGGK